MHETFVIKIDLDLLRVKTELKMALLLNIDFRSWQTNEALGLFFLISLIRKALLKTFQAIGVKKMC